jgi:hypothetical protein
MSETIAGISLGVLARLLIAAITFVHLMDMHPNPFEGLRDGNGIIPALVIDEDNLVDELLIPHFAIGLAEGPSGVVGRHDHDNFFVSIHKNAGYRELPIEQE